jgi:uncharacterized protein with HXXEE motif
MSPLEAVRDILEHSFRAAIWMFPIAVGFHFIEEAPRYAAWAHKYLSPRYTKSHWKRIHIIGFLYSLTLTLVAFVAPLRPVVFAYFAFAVAPMFFNLLFHAGTSVIFRCYSPGVVTALTLIGPVFWFLSRMAVSRGLLSPQSWGLALFVGGVVHIMDIARNNFFVADGSGRQVG